MQKVNKHWHDEKGWEKESNTVEGASPGVIPYISIYVCRENDVRRNKIIIFKNMYIQMYIYTNISLLSTSWLYRKALN
jgi:hypothetical protein